MKILISFYLPVNENFRTHLEKEAKGNSEIANCHGGYVSCVKKMM